MDSDIRQRFKNALDLFNKGEFYNCHDILEDIWYEVRDDSRNFYQGIIHISVGLHHLKIKNNIKGAILQFDKAVKKLTPYRPEFEEVEVEKLIKKIIGIKLSLQNKTKQEIQSINIHL